MKTIRIEKISITEAGTECIVNAANKHLQGGGGVAGAIFQAAGWDRLQAACDSIGYCETGSAVITQAFDLNAKYIIHAVGPVWHGGNHKEPEKLYGCYLASLQLAKDHGCHSIAFPLISAGIFGYPKEQAWRQAVQACCDFLDKNADYDMDILFAILNNETIEMGRKILLGRDAIQYKTADRNDWKTTEMPEQHDRFIFRRPFTEQQMAALKRGNIPEEMEDKWFWFMEGDTLFAHRSWTGFCIYRIDFKPDNNHVVTVNRNPEQYTCTSTEEDAKRLNNLLNWWTQDHYDYYHEWLDETVDALRKTGRIPYELSISGRTVNAFFFHKPEEPNGYLSNWYPSPFDLDGMHFSSVEQYIMYRKCVIFGDDASAKAVLATEDTAKQQAIGRKASGYIGSVWAGIRQMVVLCGLLAKFSQNEELKQKLLDTDDAYLVECAGSDKIWACGIRLNDDRRFDASNWKGNNILGFALMEVREMLKEMTPSGEKGN